ncbi:MAG: phage antirepressor KilAC domain-containing protein [Tolumonas sp.]|nr:phage antirepressor KilAC domain-containing protein [Tolumonas sp.]
MESINNQNKNTIIQANFGANSRQVVPMIAGVEITTDSEGRFNLNALHKASGAEKKNGPSYWLALETTQALIGELESQTTTTEISVVPVKVINGGKTPGTYAHELLAIAYASWISPSFHLQVNKVFLDYRTGKLQPVQQRDPMEVLNDPAAMRGILLSYTEKVLQLEEEVEKAKPVVEAYERIADGDGSMCLTDTAKTLQIQVKKLTKWLQAHSWIYKRVGGTSWVGYQDKIQNGFLEHKVTMTPNSQGGETARTQVRITPKGLAKIAKQIAIGGVA